LGKNLLTKVNSPNCTRVLHVVGSMNRAGAEVMLMNLYRLIDRSRLQFDFLYFTDNACDFDEEIRSLGGQIFVLSPSDFKSPLARMLGLKSLLIANPQIIAVHIHTTLSSAFFLLAAKWANVAIRVTHCHNTADVVSPSFVRRAYQAVAKRIIQICSTHRVACGVEAAEYLFDSAEGVILLRNGLDIDHTLRESEENVGLLRALIGAQPEEFILIQVARFTQVKNHQFSIDVLTSLQNAGFRSRLVFVGDGPLRTEVSDYAEQKGVANKTAFLGVREDVPQLMGGADAMLLPSHFEGFPVVLVESQVIGLPAIVSKTISQEVNLGVGLVSFLPIDEGSEIWSDCIRNKRYLTKTNDGESTQHLRNQGYDVIKNVHVLEGIYAG
jgi:glycosyltransferase EpsF